MSHDLFAPVQCLLRGQGGLDLVERALADGASPNAWEGPLTPLRCAVQANHVALLGLMLKYGADVNSQDARGVSPLHTAVFDGKTSCIKLLLEATADPNMPDRHGQTPLFFAPTKQVCDLLLHHRADVDARNAKHQSAVHLMACAGLTEVVSWLVDVNKNLLEVQDSKGHTPILYAAHSKVRSTVKVLQKQVAAKKAEDGGAERSGNAPAEATNPPDTQVAVRTTAVTVTAEAEQPANSSGTLGNTRQEMERRRLAALRARSDPVVDGERSVLEAAVANVQPHSDTAADARPLDAESENSEEARQENRVPNRDVVQTEIDGCLVWEVMLRKETAEDKFGFIQANGKLDFETRLVNPSQRPRSSVGDPPKLRPAEESPLPGPEVLVVRRIHEGGLLHRWNMRHPRIAVRPQDRITSINQETSVEGMQREIRAAKILVRFQRYPERFVVKLKKDGKRLGFRFERPPPGVYGDEVKLTQVLAEGALPDYNKAQVDSRRWDLVVLPDMNIVSANGVSGDANQISEELKRCEEVTMEIVRAEASLQPTSQVKSKIRMMASLFPGRGVGSDSGHGGHGSGDEPP